MITDFCQYYAPDYELDVRPSNMDNANSQDYLQKIKIQVIENLRNTAFAPSVQVTDVPRDPEGMNDEADAEMDDLDEDENPDTRYTKRRWDKYIEKDGELSDSEDEEENAANGVRKQANGAKRRRNIMDYQNPLAAPEDTVASGAMSAQSGRSQANGVASDHSDIGDSEVEDEGEAAVDDSPPDQEREDEDIDMIDGPPAEAGANNGADGPAAAQEATPPDSPESTAAEPTVPGHVVADTGNDAVDEGDETNGLDNPKIESRMERERHDADGEKAKEIVEREEDS